MEGTDHEAKHNSLKLRADTALGFAFVSIVASLVALIVSLARL